MKDESFCLREPLFVCFTRTNIDLNANIPTHPLHFQAGRENFGAALFSCADKYSRTRLLFVTFEAY
jgi:hypothetical protein